MSASKKRARGQVAVDRLPGRFQKHPDGSNVKWPVLEGYARVNVCSGAPGKNKQLSPMLLGPIAVKEHGWSEQDHGEQLYGVQRPKRARNLENLWYWITLGRGSLCACQAGQ